MFPRLFCGVIGASTCGSASSVAHSRARHATTRRAGLPLCSDYQTIHVNSSMSFLSYELHEQERHAEYFVCNFRNGPSLCLACFLHSLADPSHLDSRKLFTLREFVGLFTCDAAEGSQLLHSLLTQHASILVNGFLSAVASTQDLGLAQALHQAATHMCSCAAEFLPELFTERLLQLLLELTWPNSTPGPTAVQATAAVASGLQLLQELISTHSSAAALLSQVLQSSSELVAVMTQGLACGVEAVVVPLLHVFSCLAHSSGIAAVAAVPMGCLLPATLAKDLFISLLQLLPDLLAPDLRMLVVQVLLRLAETGYAVEQAAAHHPTAPAPILGSTSQPSDHNSQQHMLAATIMAGLKPLLLETNLQLQLLGMQLLVSVTSRASGLLLQQLIDADACEHVYEVLRGTLSTCSMRAKLAAATIADQQRRRGQSSAAADGADAAAAAEFEVSCEGLQSCAVSALRCLASQGLSFLEHFHFGIETLTDLLQHITKTANSPLLAELLTLLADVAAPHNPSSLLLPAAALAKLAAAAAAVLPDPTVHDHPADSAAPAPTAAAAVRFDSASDSSRQQGMGLQPSPELQTAYEAACTLLTHLCLKWGGSSSSTWAVLQPHILAGMHRAFGALSILTTRSLAGGYLAAACKLVTATGQVLMNAVAATSSSSKELAALQVGKQTAATAGQICSTQNKQNKGNSKHKGSAAGAADYKPFAKRRQQQRLAGSATAAANHSGLDNADVAQQQSAVDDVLLLMELVLLHLVPAASTVLTAASTELAAAAAAGSQQQQQQEGALFAQLMQAVHGVLLMLLSAGASSNDLSGFLPAFCGQLLCTNKWCSTVWSITEAHALPAAAAVDAWTVLLLVAAYLEGQAFLTGVSHTSLASLAAALSTKASSSIHVLELLCCSSSSQDQAAAAASQQQYGRNSSRQAAALAAAANTADIRRFCSVSDLDKAALCIVAAAVRSGDVCWSWQDVLITLDTVVANAGPGIVAQSDLLYNIVLLYNQAEQQLAADLVSQQYSMICSDGVLLSDQQQQQQQQYLTHAGAAAGGGGGLNPFDLAVQQLPTPSAILHAIQKAVQALPTLQPGDDLAQWVLARAVQLPAAAQQLLQRWLLLLLSAAPASDRGSSDGTSQLSEPELQQQQQISASLTSVLGLYPTALMEVLQIAKQCQELKQQRQLAAWLAVITGAVQTTISSSNGSGDYLAAVGRQGYAAKYHSDRGASTAAAGSSSSSWMLLPELLIGPSGILELLRRSLLAHLSAAASSIGAGCVIISCNSALLAVITAAAGCGGGGGMLCDQGVMEQLLQQGIRQVHLTATRLLQIPSHHPLQQQLLLSTANAANALVHVGLILRLDTVLLQQLTECQELVHVMEMIAAAAGEVEGASGAVGDLQQQQQEQQLLPQCNREEAALIQLLQVVLVQSGFGSDSSSLLIDLDGAAAAGGINSSRQLISVPKESLLLAALQWQQRLDLLSLMTQQQSPAAAAAKGSDHGVIYGLTGPHLLLMAQNAGGSVVSLLLLDSVRMLLQKQAAAAAAVLAGDCSISQQQMTMALPQMQAMLQNIVVAAASGSSSSATYQPAAVSCLAACYEAAGAAITHSRISSSISVAYGMPKSKWNLPVIKVVLDRFCQTATYLQAKVLEMDQAAAVAAAAADSAGAARAAAAAAANGCLSWVYASDCQQQVQLWCADAQLLLDYIKLLLAVVQYERMQNASTTNSRGSSSSSSGEKLLIELQNLVLQYLKQQQQMVSLICWAAARLDVVQAAAAAADSSRLGHHHNSQQQQQQHGYPEGYQSSQYAGNLQQQCGDLARCGAARHAVGQYCLQLCLCNTALQLLAGLLDSGCFGSQLPWLHQQLQQQLWAVSQQQQQGPPVSSTDFSNSTGQQLSGLMSVGALEVVDGAVVGLLRPCVVQSLLQAAGHQRHSLDCQMVLDAVAAGMQQPGQGPNA